MPQGKIGIEDLGQELKNKINKTIDIADGVENGDFTYVHPNDSQTRHVTDLEKATWNDKADKKVATDSEHGLMSNADKIKLDGIAVNANNYSHPGTHPASMISIADTSNLFTATDVEGALKEVFTSASNGKSAIASAVTGKGVAASANDSFSTLATKIGQINTGISTNDIASGKKRVLLKYKLVSEGGALRLNYAGGLSNTYRDERSLDILDNNNYLYLSYRNTDNGYAAAIIDVNTLGVVYYANLYDSNNFASYGTLVKKNFVTLNRSLSSMFDFSFRDDSFFGTIKGAESKYGYLGAALAKKKGSYNTVWGGWTLLYPDINTSPIVISDKNATEKGMVADSNGNIYVYTTDDTIRKYVPEISIV